MWPDDLVIWMKIWNKIKVWVPYFDKKKKLSKVNILFIDDEEQDFAIIKILNDSRCYWSVESMSDLNHLENEILKKADIVFLDIQWIWKKLNLKNWTSLVDKINEIYPEKILTIYSSKWFPKDSIIKSWVKTIPKSSNHETFSSYIKEVWENKK